VRKGWAKNPAFLFAPLFLKANMFSTSSLFASLIWGSIGLGYFIYGKKQGLFSAMVGGILMMAASYFTGSALAMSLVCLGIMVAVYFLGKRGY
jgi:hypothetical protein